MYERLAAVPTYLTPGVHLRLEELLRADDAPIADWWALGPDDSQEPVGYSPGRSGSRESRVSARTSAMRFSASATRSGEILRLRTAATTAR